MNTPPSAMATEGTNYKLHCFVEGEKATLTFLIPCDEDVMRLKKVIKQEIGILPYPLLDLVLWKVCKEFISYEYPLPG
jgi:hypothetical protein